MKLTLKAARIANNLKQKEAAKLLGITVDTLGRYERGTTHPDVSVLKKIEKLYGVQYESLIFLNIDNA